MLFRKDFIERLDILLAKFKDNEILFDRDLILTEIKKTIPIEEFELSNMKDLELGIRKYLDVIAKSNDNDLKIIIERFIFWIQETKYVEDFIETHDIQAAFINLMTPPNYGKEPLYTDRLLVKHILYSFSEKVEYDYSDLSDKILIEFYDKYQFMFSEEIAFAVNKELELRLEELLNSKEYCELRIVYDREKSNYVDDNNIYGLKRFAILHLGNVKNILKVYNYFIEKTINYYRQNDHLQIYKSTYMINCAMDQYVTVAR